MIPTRQLIEEIEKSEMDYMTDRMQAIQEKPGNPEGVEIHSFGSATAYYSGTMNWPTFNTVKGLRDSDIESLDDILHFFKSRDRRVQFEVVPSLVSQELLIQLAERGFYHSGFHTSMYTEPLILEEEADEQITIESVQEGDFVDYATIHCRSTGLPEAGIPHVAENNRVLYNRSGWRFYLARFNGVPAAAAVMYLKGPTASLTFAGTLPSCRSYGLHCRLLKKRIAEAALADCSLVVSQCAFLSQSHRNMERIGMKIGYVKATWSQR
ncbi:GNAT family N-acetyltransferase [Paenibacillus sp. P96]|uniref:GNAT family N-acetyltransferase n=1 Tax=Paenibacillus zeirhizosphaerae TaxID=2987519 RepID=A0ABT9FRK9_9BACL|nr:GNAT family N-acetyltransferase [Paenibacillus sp. P96]MDP4097371.1 GNAT family N-acetyltransferase [Paenibacillus sp. P96]